MSENFSHLLTSIEKRDILYGVKKLNAKELTDLGNKFKDAGWINDAIEFYGQAKNESELRSLSSKAIEIGDMFLLAKIYRTLGVDEAQHQNDIRKCAEVAENLGKIRYAIKGYEKIGDTTKVEKLRASIAQDGDITSENQVDVFIPASEEEILEENE